MNTVYTIGHSTRPINEFTEILHKNKVTQLVDIRTIPRSRHNPQYEQTALKVSLPAAGIQYVYAKDLGGLRPAIQDSHNQAWRNKSFRNYADYMQTTQFKQALRELIDLAKQQPVVIMCAEALPWRCHRSLVGDALLVRGSLVKDIMNLSSTQPHKLTSFAVVSGEDVTYPAVPNSKD